MSFLWKHIIIIPIITVFWLLAGLSASILERIRFNNGICKETNKPWILYHIDCHGYRLYKSDDYTTRVSWPLIDNNYQKELNQ